MVDFSYKDRYDVSDFRTIIHILRQPDGCPWDREQTHQSIRDNLLEEAYEAAEAIDTQDTALLKEELGDVLMQVIFHASLEEDAGHFDLDDVADGACKKLIFRHPHVFGDRAVSGTSEVLKNWDELKKQEKGQQSYTDTLNAVARSLPALWRAQKVQKRAKKAGFDWDNVQGPLDKIAEESHELQEAISAGTNVEEELGDLLFSIVNAARFLGVDPEHALNAATDKFIARFARVEALAGGGMASMSLSQLDKLWDQAKEGAATT